MNAKWMRWLMVLQLFMWVAAGCGGGGGGGGGPGARTNPPDQLVGLTVTPTSTSIANGTTVQLSAIASFGNGTSSDVSNSAAWLSSDPSVATVNSNGLVTATGPGTVHVSATDGTLSAGSDITVTDVTLTGITITPAVTTLPLGATVQLAATGAFSDGTAQNLTTAVTWATSDASIAIVTGGLVAAVGSGTVHISATLLGVTAGLDVDVPVLADVALTSITVTPDSANLAPGQTRQFTATGGYSDGSSFNLTSQVTWSSAAQAVATVDAAGLVTAGNTAGTTQVTASLNGLSGSASVVNSGATLQGITITPAAASLPVGITQQFTATASYSDGTTGDITSAVTWSSDTPAVAFILGNGLATARSAGSAWITAASGGVSAKAQLTVTGATLLSVTVLPDSPTLPAGVAQQFTVTGTYSDGSSQPLDTQAIWQTSDAAVAKIDANGLATSVAVGAVQITAIVNGVAGNTTLTVTPAVLTSLSVTPASATLPMGETLQFAATATYSDNSTVDVTGQANWVSANTAVAVANADGLVIGIAAGGPVRISAGFGGLSAGSSLTVSAAALKSIAITPSTVSLPAGLTQQLTATGTYSDNSTFNLTGSVAWSSDDSTVATVDTNGMLTAIAAGTTQVHAEGDGVSAAIPVTVTTATLQSIAVSPGNKSLALGKTQQYTAAGHYSDGTTFDVTGKVFWSSGNAAVASISAGGLTTAVGLGTAQIKAVFGTVSGSATLTVTGPTLTSITVTPSSATIALKGTQQFHAIGYWSDGSTTDLTASVKWSSSNNAVATVYRGLATGVAQGKVTVTASLKSKKSSATLTVTP